MRFAISKATPTLWFPRQGRLATGLDQVWVYDAKYQAVVAGLLLVWALAFAALLRKNGALGVVSSVPFQICVLIAFGIIVLPTAVLVPGYKHTVAFISERMSLALAVSVCALLAAAPVRRYQHVAAAILALVFFSFLYRDERVLNGVEDQIVSLVVQLPPGQRVIGGIDSTDLRVNALTHMVDRACVGRCYSYANYEPGTAQFRVRVVAENPIVVANYLDSWRMQTGGYVVKKRDLPLYQVVYTPETQVFIRALPAGAAAGVTNWNPL
jgi:hypothetical protein